MDNKDDAQERSSIDGRAKMKMYWTFKRRIPNKHGGIVFTLHYFHLYMGYISDPLSCRDNLL